MARKLKIPQSIDPGPSTLPFTSDALTEGNGQAVAVMDEPAFEPTLAEELTTEEPPAAEPEACQVNEVVAAPAEPEESADHHHLMQIREAREIMRTRKFRYEIAKEEAKEAKKAWETAADELGKIIDKGPEVLPLFDPKPAKPAAPPPPDESWKAASISELGLTKKLAEKFREAGIETMGQMEERRAKIAEGHASWPDGVGETKADRITDKILKWLDVNRDAKVMAEAAAGAPPAEVSQVERRAAELCGAAIDRKPNDPYFKDGRQSFEAGDKITSCPWIEGENQDSWILGFMAGQSEAADERAIAGD